MAAPRTGKFLGHYENSQKCQQKSPRFYFWRHCVLNCYLDVTQYRVSSSWLALELLPARLQCPRPNYLPLITVPSTLVCTLMCVCLSVQTCFALYVLVFSLPVCAGTRLSVEEAFFLRRGYQALEVSWLSVTVHCWTRVSVEGASEGAWFPCLRWGGQQVSTTIMRKDELPFPSPPSIVGCFHPCWGKSRLLCVGVCEHAHTLVFVHNIVSNQGCQLFSCKCWGCGCPLNPPSPPRYHTVYTAAQEAIGRSALWHSVLSALRKNRLDRIFTHHFRCEYKGLECQGAYFSLVWVVFCGEFYYIANSCACES